MLTKKEAIAMIKYIIKSRKNLSLRIGAIGVAAWNGNPQNQEWKSIGYVSALSGAFDIQQSELNLKREEK